MVFRLRRLDTHSSLFPIDIRPAKRQSLARRSKPAESPQRHNRTPGRIAKWHQQIDSGTFNKDLLLGWNDSRGGYVCERIPHNNSMFYRLFEKHAGKLKPFMDRCRSQTATDQVLFECRRFPFGDAGKFAAFPKVSRQRACDLAPNDLGGWLYVLSPKYVAIEKSAERANLRIPGGH